MFSDIATGINRVSEEFQRSEEIDLQARSKNQKTDAINQLAIGRANIEEDLINEQDPDAYHKKATDKTSKLYDSVLGGLDDDVKDNINNYLRTDMRNSTIDIQKGKLTRRSAAKKRSMGEAHDIHGRSAENGTFQNLILSQDRFALIAQENSSDPRNEIDDFIQKTSTEWAKNMAETQPNVLLANIKNLPVGEAEKKILEQKATNTIKKRDKDYKTQVDAGLKKSQSANSIDTKVLLKESILDGGMDEKERDAFTKTVMATHKADPDFYGAKEYLSILSAIPKITAASTKKRETRESIEGARESGDAIGHNKTNRESIDDIYQVEMSGGADPVESAVDWAKTGTWPQSVWKKATSAALSKEYSDDAKLIADIRRTQLDEVPMAVNLPNKSFYDDFNMLRESMPPEQAYKIVYDAATNVKKGNIATKFDLVKMKRGKIKVMLEESEGVRAWESTPNISKHLTNQINETAKMFYASMPPQTRNAELATQRAIEEMSEEIVTWISPDGDKEFLFTKSLPDYEAKLQAMEPEQLEEEVKVQKREKARTSRAVERIQDDFVKGSPVTLNDAKRTIKSIDDISDKDSYLENSRPLDFLWEAWDQKDQGGMGGMVKWIVREMEESNADERTDLEINEIEANIASAKAAGDTKRVNQLNMDRIAIEEGHLNDYLARYKDARDSLNMPDMEWAEIIDTAIENPTEVSKGIFNALVQDPWQLFLPAGVIRSGVMGTKTASRVVQASNAIAASKTLTTAVMTTGKVVGATTGGAVLGGGASVGAEYFIQMGGQLNPEQFEKALGMGTVAGGVFGAAYVPVAAAFRRAVTAVKGDTKITGDVDTIVEGMANEVASGEELSVALARMKEQTGIELTPEEVALIEPKIKKIQAVHEASEMGQKSEKFQKVVEEITQEDFDEIFTYWGREVAKESDMKIDNVAPADATTKTGVPRKAGKFKQGGSIDPEILVAATAVGTTLTAAASVGAFLNPEDRESGAKTWATHAGLMVTALAGGKRLMTRAGKYKDIFGKAVEFDQLFRQSRGNADVDTRHSIIFNKTIENRIPDLEGREKITQWLDGEDVKLNDVELDTANQVRSWLDAIHAKAKEAGVVSNYLESYVPHIWKHGDEHTSFLMEALDKGGQASGKTKHSRQRKLINIEAGKAKGLEIQSMDILDILTSYNKSMTQAIRTKQLIDGLRKSYHESTPMVISKADQGALAAAFKKAGEEFVMPKNYKKVRLPALADKAVERYQAVTVGGKEVRVVDGAVKVGDKTYKIKEGQQTVSINGKKVSIDSVKAKSDDFMMVHPDMVDPLKNAFDPGFDNWFMNSMLPANFIAKRMLVSTSGFHANALLESTVYAGTNPANIPRYAKMLMQHGDNTQAIDDALRSGLKLGIVDDVASDSFYAAFKDIRGAADRLSPIVGRIAGAPVDAFVGLNKGVDAIMWDTIATGGKLQSYFAKMEALVKRGVPEQQARIQAAKFTNDAFGGQDWAGLAENLESRIARKMAFGLTSKAGRQVMQLAMFAPDWTISNVRILGKALPGVTDDPKLRALHQAYFIRSAIIYAVVWDAVNMSFSGQHIWDNDDPTTVDMGDGRRFQPTKQFTEFFHWFKNPGGSALNKMGVIGKEMGAQFMNKEWLSVHGAPTMVPEDAGSWENYWTRAKHVGSNLVPIGFQAAADAPDGEGFQRWGAGMVGHPIYGNYDEE
ncbi:MAG: hypothetical protein IME93_03195 [Proteobacteria bacterium]|nr:hypothetical protein [Pseudomonadota bacterium]